MKILIDKEFLQANQMLEASSNTWDYSDIRVYATNKLETKMISNDQELIQSDPTSCPQNQKGNN